MRVLRVDRYSENTVYDSLDLFIDEMQDNDVDAYDMGKAYFIPDDLVELEIIEQPRWKIANVPTTELKGNAPAAGLPSPEYGETVSAYMARLAAAVS